MNKNLEMQETSKSEDLTKSDSWYCLETTTNK